MFLVHCRGNCWETEPDLELPACAVASHAWAAMARSAATRPESATVARAWEVFVSNDLVGFLRARLDERERIWTERGRAAAMAGDSTAIWDAFWHARDIESKRRIITTAWN